MVLAAALALQGCIRHNESGIDCDRTHVIFRYYGDVPGKCRFMEKTDQVTLFVYDSDGKLVSRRTKLKSEMASYAGMNLNLPDGDYELVAWTNISHCTEVKNGDQLSEASVGCTGYYASTDGTVKGRENDRMYFARKHITVVQSEFRDEEMEFSQNHVPIYVYVANAGSPTRATMPVEIGISNINPQMAFDGHCSAVTATYYPPLTYNEETGEYVCRLNAYRFGNQNNIMVTLYNSGTGEIYKEQPLADFMTANSVSVDDKDEAGIAMRFRFAPTGVEIAPWEEENIDPGLN